MTEEEIVGVHARRLLRTAADLLEEHGWCQGTHTTPTGEHCAIGALSAARLESDDLTVIHAARQLLAEQVCYRRANFGSVTRWNDHHTTTAGNVIRAMRKAAGDAGVSQAQRS